MDKSLKILLGSQFYTPSVGGVQEVMRQLGEELAKKGHHVTIATTQHPDRQFKQLNAVNIESFDISGNGAMGMSGQIQTYQDFVLNGDFDIFMVMAAQQWTFDALWPVLDKMTCTKKVFIPCGFSGFYDPLFADYFAQMPDIMAKFDHLVFHSSKYRDIDFAKACGLSQISVIPCGASVAPFSQARDLAFRKRHAVADDSFLFLTVGSFTGMKGHKELLGAFSRLALLNGRRATLMLNGNTLSTFGAGEGGLLQKAFRVLRSRGLKYAIDAVHAKIFKSGQSFQDTADQITQSDPNKQVIICDLPRGDVVQAFMNADLFVFASNIEYSPLVLFESAAAGTPFLSVDVGNTPEIAEWTGAGVICPSTVDDAGFTQVDEGTLANAMVQLMEQPDRLEELGEAGRTAWSQELNWAAIAQRYEELLFRLSDKQCAPQDAKPVDM